MDVIRTTLYRAITWKVVNYANVTCAQYLSWVCVYIRLIILGQIKLRKLNIPPPSVQM